MKTAWIARAAATADAVAGLLGPAFAAPQPSPVTSQLIAAATEEIKKKYSQYFGI
jgi:hypothetical protein